MKHLFGSGMELPFLKSVLGCISMFQVLIHPNVFFLFRHKNISDEETDLNHSSEDIDHLNSQKKINNGKYELNY